MVAALVAAAINSTAARADTRVSFVLEHQHTREGSHYVTGLREGLEWANTAAESAGRKLYCPPQGFLLTNEQIVHFLKLEVERKPNTRNDPASVTALIALVVAFPCR